MNTTLTLLQLFQRQYGMTKQNKIEQLNRYQFIKLYEIYTYLNKKNKQNVSYMY